MVIIMIISGGFIYYNSIYTPTESFDDDPMISNGNPDNPPQMEYESLNEKSQYFDLQTPLKINLENLGIPCYMNYNNSKRYMYQAIPPARNSSADLRSSPGWIKPVNTKEFGIFKHTGIYGNNRDVRECKLTS